MVSFGQMRKLRLKLRNLYKKAQAELGLDLGFPDSGAPALDPAGRTKTSHPALPLRAQTGRLKPRRGPAPYPTFFYAGLSTRKSRR